MTGSPTVSVVLPTYNAETYLRDCLSSLRAQTFTDFEVVVVDDGSTDGTLSILSDEDVLDLRVIRRDDADGLPGALNRGFREADGEYVARQDADDRSHPGRLEQQVSYLDAHPDVALLGTSARLIDGSGARIETRVVRSSPTFDALLSKNRFVHGSVLIRREPAFEVGLYDEQFEYSEDYDLWLRLAAEHPVANLQGKLYDLRIHDESIYGSELRTVKLYSAFARMRATGETTLSVDAVREHGVDRVYERLSPAERARFHTEMAQALLRYGNLNDARSHCRSGLEATATRPMLWAFLLLSYTTPGVVAAVVRAYRQLLNVRTSGLTRASIRGSHA